MHIAIDVGGTFTDLVVAFQDGAIVGYKTPSTRPNIIEGVFNGFELIARSQSVSLAEFIQQLERIDFGTTAATNALLEGKAARTGLIVTKGFRDILLVREGGKNDSYDMKAVYPAPYVPRSLTVEVEERITAEGDVLVPLDEGSVIAAIAALKAAKIDAIAISLLWSIANSSHERRIAQLVRKKMPDVAISLGHEVNPSIREYRRTIATAIDASLKPLVAENVTLMEKKLSAFDFKGVLTYSTSSGGKASSSEILKRPILLCFSGPSAAPGAGLHFAHMEGLGSGNVVTVDMGGTSFDVSIATGGKLPMHREGTIGDHLFGVPSVEIHSIGAGGGSIARVDEGGFIHVGPESSGSQPGPACYQRGGIRATVTDANLIAGCLNEAFSAGAGMTLSRPLAQQAIRRDVAGKLHIDAEAAAGLITLACEQSMVAAIEEVTINRGVDPRDYVMVAGGAAAGAHAVAIARELGIKTVIIPKMAGVLSAFGILSSEVSFGFTRTLLTSTDNFDKSGVARIFNELSKEGIEFLKSMSVPDSNHILQFSCEGRYRGQVWQLTLPLSAEDIRADDAANRVATRFHEEHAALYSTSSKGEPVELTEWNLLARGKLKEIVLPEVTQSRDFPPPKNTRRIYFKELRRAVDTPVFGPSAIPISQKISGPVVIDEELTTIVVDPNTQVRLSRFGNYIVELIEASSQPETWSGSGHSTKGATHAF